MKRYVVLLAIALGIAASARSEVLSTNWTGNFANGGVVPDDDLNGLTISETPEGFIGAISDVAVTLELRGGWNGDIYAYLYHDGVMSLLLNRVGSPANAGLGYGDTGFNVTFSDAAQNSIHNYQDHSPTIVGGVVLGTWKPDGNGLSVFNGGEASGTWSLYLVDMSQGGQMTLDAWSLQVTTETVPEPSTASIAVLVGAALLLNRRRRVS
ncbi:MAG TPA: hypothetical protein VK327_07960 [Candidatus Paceibacterota bacterium]|nr:hypothetical protein [Candidatus Paceibacterota bacterium]